TQAKKISSITAHLRHKPHSINWEFFIYIVLLDPTNTQNTCKRSILFLLFFCLGRCLYNYHNQPTSKPSRRIQLVHVVRRCSAEHGGEHVLKSFCSVPVLHGVPTGIP